MKRGYAVFNEISPEKNAFFVALQVNPRDWKSYALVGRRPRQHRAASRWIPKKRRDLHIGISLKRVIGRLNHPMP